METNQKPETAPAQPAPAKDTYFKKAQFNMPLFVGGKRVEFEPLGSNYGVLRVPAEDEATRLNMIRMAEAGRGVVQITREQYEELKKKLPWTPSANRSKTTLKVWDPRGFKRPQPRKSAESAAAESKQLASAPGVVGSGNVVGGGGAPAGPGVPLTPSMKRLTKPASGPTVRVPAIEKMANTP